MTNLYGPNDYYSSGPHEPETRDDYDSLRDEPRDEDLAPERASNVAWRARLEAR